MGSLFPHIKIPLLSMEDLAGLDNPKSSFQDQGEGENPSLFPLS
jgi:hypothetical protein